MKVIVTTTLFLSIALSASAETEKTSVPFKSDYGTYEITDCAGQTFQLDCKLKSVTIAAGKTAAVIFTFKSEDGKTVSNELQVLPDDNYSDEDGVAVFSTQKRKNASNWSEESHEVTLDKSNAKALTLTFAVVRDNLGKSVKRQIEYKIRRK